MHKLAATLNNGGQPVLSPAASPEIPRHAGGGVRFAYASGARPLDGFTIKRGVGVGGFGEVYYALSDAGKEVALKRIQRNLDVELRGVSQCLNLKHPGLVSLYDIRYDAHGEAWVIMEFVAGESLKEVIDRNPNGLPVEDVQRWFREMGTAVAYLHDHGIVHRDLKPGNIFIDQGQVKIGDYGLSKFISCSRRSGQTESVGTFHYMAPEIGKGVYGKEIDVYALGVMLYEMLSGRLPFDGESGQEIIMKHLTAEPELAGLPRPFRAVVQRALLKDPSKRYTDVQQMLRDLQQESTNTSSPAASKRQVAAQPEFVVAEALPGVAGHEDGMVFGPLRTLKPPLPAVRAGQPVPVSGDEPIARAVRESWTQGRSWWTNAQLGTPVKVILLVVAAVALVVNSEWLIPLGVLLGATYLVYFGVRSLVLAMQMGPAPLPAPAAAATPPLTAAMRTAPPAPRAALARRGNWKKRVPWRQAARDELKRKPISERCAELSGAMLLSALAAAVLCLIAMLIGGKPLDTSVYTWSFYAWLTCSSTVIAWTMLTLGKFWEDNEGDPIHRRFILLIVGLLLGGVTYGLRDFLEVRLNNDLVVRTLPHVPVSLYEIDGSPHLAAYLLYFSGMFVLLRWWRQVDPLRSTRLSVWDTTVCVLAAWILQMFVPFYQPWGFMLAASSSIAIQLSAPWVGAADRERLRRQAQEV